MTRKDNKRHAIAWGVALAFAPSACLANGWVSGVTAFRQTPEFYFIFSAIVLIESIIIWFWLRPINPLAVFWRVLALNTVSSLAGDVLFRLDWTPRSGDLWRQAIPFFLVTIALEIPLARALFRKRPETWRRAALIFVSANVASYVLLMAIDRPVRAVWLNNLRAADRKIFSEWTNAQMLAEAPGRIYATESASGGPAHRLKFFDFTSRRWQSVSNSPALDPRYWHVEGDLLAFLTYGDPASHGVIKLTTLPGCAEIRELRLPGTSYGYNSWDIAISPDRARLAVLAPLHEIRGPLSGSSYQVLGHTHALIVFDLATGAATIGPRKAAGNLCWLPDSRTILFHSFRDEKLHEITTLPKGWKKEYDLAKPGSPFLEPPVFAYRLDSGTVEPFANTPAPRLAADANQLAFQDNTGALRLFTLADKSSRRVALGQKLGAGSPEVSPDGRFALVPLALNPYFSRWGHPAIVDLNDPTRRYYFGPTIYRVVWARTGPQKN